MESICCCAATENGTVDVQKKDFVMGGALRNIGYGSLITAISLLPNFAANAQGPNPDGGDPKTEQTSTLSIPGQAKAYSKNGQGIGIAMAKGPDNKDWTNEQARTVFKQYLSERGVQGEVFILNKDDGHSEFAIFIQGKSMTANRVNMDDFMKLLPQAVIKQKELYETDNKLTSNIK